MPKGMSALAVLLLPLWAGCGLLSPPPTPDPGLLGCYGLETDLPASYSDSLSYHLPSAIRLDYRSDGRWSVYPTEEEMQPTWTNQDGLPSGHLRRQVGFGNTPVLEWDSVTTIPGDSIDIRFPGFEGTLVLRVGPHPDGLGGRAEWVIQQQISFMNEGVTVLLRPTSCAAVPSALRRTRRPWLLRADVPPDTGRAPGG